VSLLVVMLRYAAAIGSVITIDELIARFQRARIIPITNWKSNEAAIRHRIIGDIF